MLFFRRMCACAALLMLTLSACASQPASLTPQQQISDGVTIELSAAEQPRLNQPQEFIIRLLDSAGQPIDSAEVYLDLDMPAMPMGSNQPIAEGLGEGRYRTQSAYTMTGEWLITVVAKINGVEHRVIFNREVAQ